ncbi:hypothetical protein Tco_0518311 [Tanacetum coccineum]
MDNDADQPLDDSTQTKDKDPKKYWFKQPPRPPTPYQEWNKHQVVVDQPEQPWFNNMVSPAKDLLTFEELNATLIDFSKYAMNQLKIDNLTQAHLVGPMYELLKGTCISSIEHEYNMEECIKVLTENLIETDEIGINKWYQSFALRNFDLEVMEFESAHSNTTAKLSILKLVTKMLVPVTAEEKTNKKNDVKARSLLLMALPNEH